MQILDAQIDWREDVGNDPILEVLIDEYPDISDMVFEKITIEGAKTDLYYAELDGFTRYFAWSGDGNDGGYGGDTFTIKLKTGGEVTLKGPYSSRTGIVNKYSYGPVIDTNTTDNEKVLERGYTYRRRSITVEKAKEALNYIDEDITLNRVVRYDNNEPYYVPQRE